MGPSRKMPRIPAGDGLPGPVPGAVLGALSGRVSTEARRPVGENRGEPAPVRLRESRNRYTEDHTRPAAARSYHTKYEREFHKRVSNRTERALLERILARAGAVDSVLDVPSGTGRVSDIIARRARTVFEFDYSLEMVRLLRASREGYSPRLGVATVFHLPFRDRTFDLVVSIRLSHHIPDVEGRLWHIEELLRVSRRYVLVTFFDSGSVKNRLREFRRGIGGRKRSKYTLSRRQVVELAHANGFEPVGLWRLSFLFSGHTFALLERRA